MLNTELASAILRARDLHGNDPESVHPEYARGLVEMVTTMAGSHVLAKEDVHKFVTGKTPYLPFYLDAMTMRQVLVDDVEGKA